MGIQGLLPLLKSTMKPIHIKEMEGCSVAIDTYSWLHKAAFSCCVELCKGLPTSRHIEYCMHRINLLRHHGVKPVLVFDGGLLPMKTEQENKRARARKENLARALEHESNGNSSGAYEFYQKAVDISPSIAHELIQVLKQENVAYVVAPYEADAQMTFLAICNQVHAVITEDSDLIPFGCPRIIFKMDKYGQGVEFESSRLQQNKELSFVGFTKEMLLEMCILSGCDYLQSLPGMGLKRAHSLISKFKSYDKVIRHLKYSSVSIPPLYEESFKKALLTFQYQRVYDPMTEGIVHLSDIPDNLGDDLDFLGPFIPQHIAKGIANGDLDPFTKMPFEGKGCDYTPVHNETTVCESFKPEGGRRKLDLPVQKNLLTKYFCFASLEAKREFRAPRTSPVSTRQEDNFTVIPKERCSVEASYGDMNCSPASPNFSGSERDMLLTEMKSIGNVGSDPVVEVPDALFASGHGMANQNENMRHSLLQHSDQVHRPSWASLKECESKNVLIPFSEKTRTENKKVIIRSSYFQRKLVNETDQDNEAKDKADPDMLKDGSVDGCKANTMNKKKVNVSSYFQHKSVSKNDHDNKQERLSVKDDEGTNTNEDIYQMSAHPKSNIYHNRISFKRKSFLDDNFHGESIRPKQICMEAPLSDDGLPGLNVDETLMRKSMDEEKFGSNISHLSHYADIAEKSMERFVSVISSFKCNSSGSRASGLRAPLRDIKNTCSSSRSAVVDFSHFAYKPSRKKNDAPSQRR